jgi:hypothetical protein
MGWTGAGPAFQWWQINLEDVAGESFIGIEEGTIFAKPFDVFLVGIEPLALIKAHLPHSACSRAQLLLSSPPIRLWILRQRD